MVFVPRLDGRIATDTEGFFDSVAGSWEIAPLGGQGERVVMTCQPSEVSHLYVWRSAGRRTFTAEYFGVPKTLRTGESVRLSCDYYLMKEGVFPRMKNPSAGQ